jgi:hypothetical protein
MKKLLLVLVSLFFTLGTVSAAIYGTPGEKFKSRGYVSNIQNPAFESICAMGLVSECDFVVVYGEDPSVDGTTADIWDSGGTHTYQADASADIVSIASSSASDTMIMTIKGLDAAGDELTQSATLNGSTRVAITGLWRVLSVENDNSTDAVGNVFVYQGTSTVPSVGGSTVRAAVLIGNHINLAGLWTIPNDKVALLTNFNAGIILQDATADMESLLYVRKYGKDWQIKDRTNFSLPEKTDYQSSKNIIIPGKSDIKCAVLNDTTTDTPAVNCSFDLLIFDEAYFEDSFLTDIGQP